MFLKKTIHIYFTDISWSVLCSVVTKSSLYTWFHLTTVILTSQLFPLSLTKAPSAPSYVHFSELTTTSVNVSWGEPKQANGIIEGYRLVYEPCTPVDGEKLLEPNNSAIAWHSSACFSHAVIYNLKPLNHTLFFDLRCLSLCSNLLQMSVGPAVTYMAWLIKYVGVLYSFYPQWEQHG